MELESAGLTLVHRHANDVGRQHVAGELDAVEVEAEGAREHLRKRRLAHAGEVLDQQVAAGQQARKGKADLGFLAEDDLAGRLDDDVHRRLGTGLQPGFEEHARIVRARGALRLAVPRIKL